MPKSTRTAAVTKPGDRPVVFGESQLVPLNSFWMGGFESACQINGGRRRVDLVAATQHDRFADLDYQLLREQGLLVARDGLRWHQIEQAPGRFDFASLDSRLDAARRHGIQVIWNLCHYGWPEDLDILGDEFVPRFAAFARAAARYILDRTEGVPLFAPMNETSFLAWAIGERGFIFPYARGQAGEVKRQLVRAALAACDAIWDVDLRARFVHTDPIFHVFPPRWKPELADAAAAQKQGQYEAWDMIAGMAAPELGGHRCYLDILGVNYYHNNQWEHPETPNHWHLRPVDDRRMPLSQLLTETWKRYQRPLIMTETSHVGEGKAQWLAEVTDEVVIARKRGVPIEGVCLYPVIDRPDWEDPQHWHHSGLWDLVPDDMGHLQRVLDEPYARQLRRSQERLERGPVALIARGETRALRDAC